jgi:histidyl-tRNA synthetase
MPVQLARGTRDILPTALRARRQVVSTLAEVFARAGFEPLETPAIERLDTLMGKYGDEGDKLMFRILERGEGAAAGRTDLGLRYDLTVPLARLVAMHPELALPFRRYQVQPVWRADRPQAGRFREFVQCDGDIVGAPGPIADAECLALVSQGIRALGFTAFTVKVNHRGILTAIAAAAGIPEGPALVAIDKLDKVGRDGVSAELRAQGHDPSALWSILDGDGPAAFGGIAPDAARSIDEVLRRAADLGASNLRFDATLARGLGYYTGAVYEVVIEDSGVGSVAGGGRYDGLIGMFCGREVPAVGVSFGLDRLLTVMEARGMLGGAGSGTRAFVTLFDEPGVTESLAFAAELRAAGIATETWLGPAGALGRQLKQAAGRGIPFALVMGPDERAAGNVAVKDLRSGEQRVVPRAGVMEVLR